jgi:hypothetical protein
MRKCVMAAALCVFAGCLGIALADNPQTNECCPGTNCPCPQGCTMIYDANDNPKYIFYVANSNLYSVCQADTNTCTSVLGAFNCVYYSGYPDSNCSGGTDGTGPHNMPQWGCTFQTPCS